MADEHRMEEIIDFVLRKNADRITAGAGYLSPMSPREWLEAQERPEDMDEDQEGSLLKVGEEWAVRQEAINAYREFLLSAGPDPLEVIRRFFAEVKAMAPHLIGDMSGADLALLLGYNVQWDPTLGEKGEWSGQRGRASVSALIKRVYNGKLKEAGMRACKAPFQKSEEAVQKCREAQKGNQNRAKKKGRKKR